MKKIIKSLDNIYSISSNELIDVTTDIADIDNITPLEFDTYGFNDSTIEGNALIDLKALSSFEILLKKTTSDSCEALIYVEEHKSIEEPEILIYSSSSHNPSSIKYRYEGNVVVTTTKHSISTLKKTGIEKIEVLDNTSTNTSVKYLVSFDGKKSWHSFLSGSFEEVDIEDIQIRGMDKTQIEAITLNQWDNIFVENATIDFAISFDNYCVSESALVEEIKVKFEENLAPDIRVELSSNEFRYDEITLKGEIFKANQKVRYRVTLNGISEPWSAYMVPYVLFERKYNFNTGVVSGNNTIKVEAMDQFGVVSEINRQILLRQEDAIINIAKPIGSVQKDTPYAFPFKITPPFYANNKIEVRPKRKEVLKSESFNIYSYSVKKDKAVGSKIEEVRILNAANRIYLFKVADKIYTFKNGLKEEVLSTEINESLFIDEGFISFSKITEYTNEIESDLEILVYSNIDPTDRDFMYSYVSNDAYFRYRVYIDDPEMTGSVNHVLRDWTNYFTKDIDASIIVPSNIVNQLNPYCIFVEVEQIDGKRIQSIGKIHLYNDAPTIFGNVVGRTAEIIIGDSGRDKVKFKLMLNGKKIYPESTSEFTRYMQSPVDFKHAINFKDYRIGRLNNLEVVAIDEFGEQSSLILSFIGKHTGLLFVDENNNPFMTEDGTELDKLDFGIVYAGRMSEIQEAYVHNMCDYKVKNINVFVDEDTVDEYADVEISKTREPFELHTALSWEDELDIGERKKFYIRVRTSHLATNGSVFKIKSKADPC